MCQSLPIACCGVESSRESEHADRGHDGHNHDGPVNWKAISPVALCGLLLAVGYLAGGLGYEGKWIFAVSALAGAWPTSISTYHSLRQLRLNVDLLMLLGALGAAAVGHIDEAAILMFLFSLAELLETFALGRTRRALRSLMSLRPDDANVQRAGQWVRLPLNEIAVGEIIGVQPGERIPLDGVILSGSADIDESALTGESVPQFKEPDSTVLAGSINLSGALQIRTTRGAGESTLARIVQLVERARGSQAQTQRLLNRYVVFYVAVVLAGATLIALVPPLVLGAQWREALYRAMTLLVVASPCALVISTPATILSAIAVAARRGILFKGGAAVESLGQANAIAFDKTGTLTDGRLAVSHVIPWGNATVDEILALAAAAEAGSEHPLAQAIVREAKEQLLPIAAASGFRTTAGLGVTAEVDGKAVVVGSRRFLESHGLSGFTSEEEAFHRQQTTVAAPGNDSSIAVVGNRTTQGKSIYVAADGIALGVVILADRLRTEASAAIAKLRDLGIHSLVMLTGDESRAAEEMATASGVDTFHAGLLPEEKVEHLRDLATAGKRVVMVGDGINDAPALATAEVGVAMGAAGTDLAIESADVVLMSSHLGQLVEAVAIGQRARRTLKQNLLFASAVIVVLVGYTLLGELAITTGVLGHEGSTLVVIFNGLRLLVSPRVKLASAST
jgi:Cd2+/Zn2+-exporting ATPase